MTGGTLDLTNLNYKRSLWVGPISDIYVPLRSPAASPRDQIHFLVVTKNREMLAIAEKMRDLKSEGDALLFVQEHAQELIVRKDVEGLVRYGVDLEDEDVRKLRKLNDNLAQDFVVLAD